MENQELAELVERARQGDSEAFGHIYDRFVDRVYGFVLHQVGNPADAEDITTGVFLDALKQIGRFRWKGAGFSAWLFRIARNDVLDFFRKQGRSRETELSEETLRQPAATLVDEQVAADWEAEELRRAIRGLSPDQQQVVLLKLLMNFSNRQIGEVLGKKEGAIKALQHRALLALKESLQGSTETQA